MANENLADRKYVPTQPYDSTDVPKFGQLVETAKDTFASELKSFFSYKTSDATYKISEMPNIEKFALGASTNEQNLEEVVDLIISYSDTPDRFPMVAITSASNRERKLGIGNNFVDHVQYPPSICGTVPGPYNLTTGWTIEITTWPSGYESDATTSLLTFASSIFADITNVTTQELAHAINHTQALYYQCSVTADDCLRIETGGPCAVTTPNYIEITDGDSDCLTALGFTIGQSDSYLNVDNPPKNRYIIAGDMNINIDVVTDDINTRSELSDLVYDFFTFYMEKRRFQFIGRSYQSRNISPEEWFHIIFQNQFNWSGELQKLRPGGGEAKDYIYATRGSMPIFISDFIDRKIVTEPVFLLRDNVVPDEVVNIPTGDYTGDNWKKKLNKI